MLFIMFLIVIGSFISGFFWSCFGEFGNGLNEFLLFNIGSIKMCLFLYLIMVVVFFICLIFMLNFFILYVFYCDNMYILFILC